MTATTPDSESTSSIASMLGDFGRFLYFPFFLLVFFGDEGWSLSDESTVDFLCFLTGASGSLALEALCRFEDFLFEDCVDSLGGGLFNRLACLEELGGMVEWLNCWK